MVSMNPVRMLAYIRSYQVGPRVSWLKNTGVANISTGAMVIMR